MAEGYWDDGYDGPKVDHGRKTCGCEMGCIHCASTSACDDELRWDEIALLETARSRGYMISRSQPNRSFRETADRLKGLGYLTWSSSKVSGLPQSYEVTLNLTTSGSSALERLLKDRAEAQERREDYEQNALF